MNIPWSQFALWLHGLAVATVAGCVDGFLLIAGGLTAVQLMGMKLDGAKVGLVLTAMAVQGLRAGAQYMHANRDWFKAPAP